MHQPTTFDALPAHNNGKLCNQPPSRNTVYSVITALKVSHAIIDPSKKKSIKNYLTKKWFNENLFKKIEQYNGTKINNN